MAIGIDFFLLPNKLSSGGFSGIATIFYYLFDIPMGFTVMALNTPIFIFAYFKIGKKFFAKSVTGTATLSIFLNIFENVRPFAEDKFLGCVFGGILVGIGTAIVLRSKGSTGGSDLVSYVIRKYKPNMKTGTLIVIIDIFIIALNVIAFRKIEVALYSAITIYLMGKMIDIVFEGIYFKKQMFIISNKNNKISEVINKEIRRGTTGLYGRGMYNGEDKIVLLCVVSRPEVIKIIDIVKRIDGEAFVIINNAREVIGKGFKK